MIIDDVNEYVIDDQDEIEVLIFNKIHIKDNLIKLIGSNAFELVATTSFEVNVKLEITDTILSVKREFLGLAF